MNETVKSFATTVLIVCAASGVASAAECLKEVRPFPNFSQHSDPITRNCGAPGTNRTIASAINDFTPGVPDTKAVVGQKLIGLQTSVVQGVQANNTPITGCSVSVNDPADGGKVDSTGCINAAKWQLRMFDN
jgi:hypothetical protein